MESKTQLTDQCEFLKEKCKCGKYVCLKTGKKLLDAITCKTKEHEDCLILKQTN